MSRAVMPPRQTDVKPATVARTVCKKRAVFPAPASGMGVWRRRHAAPARSPAWAIAYGSCGSPAVSSLPTVTEGPSLNIIGISGFEGSIPFKRARSPNLDEREYRISQGHDSAAALVVDGTVVAAVAEERISRRKHTGDFPKGAIAYCLAEAGLAIGDVHELVHGFDYAPYRGVYALDPVSHDLYRDVYSRDALLALVARDVPGFPAERVRHVAHHAAHAASAYYTSGWDECLVIVIDGMGEAQSASVYHARDGHLDRIFQIGAPDSIGILYSVVTLHLGFDFNADEYKIMGLAPAGAGWGRGIELHRERQAALLGDVRRHLRAARGG